MSGKAGLASDGLNRVLGGERSLVLWDARDGRIPGRTPFPQRLNGQAACSHAGDLDVVFQAGLYQRLLGADRLLVGDGEDQLHVVVYLQEILGQLVGTGRRDTHPRPRR